MEGEEEVVYPRWSPFPDMRLAWIVLSLHTFYTLKTTGVSHPLC